MKVGEFMTSYVICCFLQEPGASQDEITLASRWCVAATTHGN